MSRYLSPLNEARRIALGLSLIVAFSFFFSGNVLAQTRPVDSKSLLGAFAAKTTSNLKASFTYNPRYPKEGQTVQFADVSTGSPVSWRWDFGDGTASTERNPIHVYTTSGFRKITLIVANDNASRKSTKTLTVIPAPSPATFVFSPATPGPGQTVQFADTTSGNPSVWRWSFGDGTTSTVKNPSHAFSKAGSYTISLTASEGSTSKEGSKTLTVASMSVLTSSFTYSPASPAAGQAVQFTDTSTGSPTAWSWSFGDGTTSTAQNPSHAYAMAGSKTVTLTINNSNGSNSATRTVTVTTALAASFTYSPASPTAGQAVQFTDTSTGSPTAWSWNFGDGATSTVRSPNHTFISPGSYNVVLIVQNAISQDSENRGVAVVPSGSLTASFTFSPASPAVGQEVQFSDTSTGSPTSWQWDFGDGASSTSQNPNHTYTAASTYAITLMVSNESGTTSTSRTISVSKESTIIPSDRLIDWSKAGAWDVRTNAKGIPNYPVGIDLTGLTSYGGYPLDRTGVADSRNAIQAALNACPAYSAVLLGPGSYMIGPSGGLSIPSYKVLRGTEPFTTHPLTTLIQHHGVAKGVNLISISASYGYSSVVNIISCTKGSDAITVNSVSGFSIGDQVVVDELNQPGLVDITDYDMGTCTWCSRDSGMRALGETKIIKAIDAVNKTIQFTRPVYKSYANTPQVCKIVAAESRRVNAGIESLKLTHDGAPPGGDTCDAVEFTAASYCWAKRVETADIYYKHFLAQYYNIGLEIRECYLHDVPQGYSVAGNYGIGNLRQNTDCLYEDNIVYHVHSSITLGSGGSTGNVIAYNYLYNEYHDTTPTWFMGGTGHHGAHPYMNLWEGNYMRKIYTDSIHGSCSHSVFLRNRVTGVPVNPSESDHSTSIVNGEMGTVQVVKVAYYFTCVGNVLGTAGFQTVYETYPVADSAKQIWKIGLNGSSGSQSDALTVSTFLRHGNYDYVTRSTVWDAGISDHVLPNSLYLTAKPAFLGGLSWPAYGPDLNPMESDIPAKYRFDTKTYFADPSIK
jgi:PKD repeat protein